VFATFPTEEEPVSSDGCWYWPVTGAACSHCSPDKRPLSELAVSDVKSSVRNDADMQAVLNQYARFDPRAIEKSALLKHVSSHYCGCGKGCC
jgi:hypothetical protein